MTAQAEAPHAALAATAALRVHNSAVRWGRGSDASCLELALACTRPWLIPSPLTLARLAGRDQNGHQLVSRMSRGGSPTNRSAPLGPV
jgi:hypothetical protein